MAKRKTASKEVVVPGKRTDAEQALLSHMENGYELQTDLLGANRVLRWLKGDEEIRPASAKSRDRQGAAVAGSPLMRFGSFKTTCFHPAMQNYCR